VVSLCFFIVCAYSVSSAASLLFSKRAELAFLIAPYDTNNALSLLDEKAKNGSRITTQEANILNIFHRNNSEVLTALAQNYEHAGNNHLALTYYELSNELDPLNENNFILRERSYLRNGEYWRFFNEYKASLIKKHPDYNFSLLKGVVFSDKDVDPDTHEELNSQIRLQLPSSEKTEIKEASINFFFLGYGLVKAKPYEAKQLFIIARDLSPGWSYFHLGLASYYYYFENQKALAWKVLNNCLQFEYARDHCAEIIQHSVPGLDKIKNMVITIP
jgi:tetratricopeptide (TPR) repeat protein